MIRVLPAKAITATCGKCRHHFQSLNVLWYPDNTICCPKCRAHIPKLMNHDTLVTQAVAGNLRLLGVR